MRELKHVQIPTQELLESGCISQRNYQEGLLRLPAPFTEPITEKNSFLQIFRAYRNIHTNFTTRTKPSRFDDDSLTARCAPSLKRIFGFKKVT